MRRLLVLLVLPLALLGPALLPGQRFLPLLPAAFEPLATEDPAAAARALDGANLLAVDAVFPALTDQLAIRESLRAGHLPTWSPLQGLGAPLFGGTIAGPAYPPNVLRALAPPDLAAGWLALLALVLAGLGAWLFLERRGFPRGACASGALAFQAGGWGLANLHLAMKVDAALWLPWALWAVDGLLQRRTWSGLVLFAALACALLAGFVGIGAMVALAALAYAALRAVSTGAPKRRLAAVAVWSALGVCAAAVQLVPMVEASLHSRRGIQTAPELRAQTLPGQTALGMVVPHLFGHPQEQPFADRDAATWWLVDAGDAARAEQANALEWSLFAGAGAVALAVAGIAAAPGAALLPLAGLALALGFAQGWPLVRLLHLLPPLALGAPARAAAIAWFLWAWLAALGARELLAGERRALAGGAAACALLGVLALWLLSAAEPQASVERLPPLLAERHDVALERVRELLPADSIAASARRVRAGALHLALFAALGLAAQAAAWLLARKGRAGLAWTPLAVVLALEGAVVGAPHLAPRALEGAPLLPESPAMAAVAHAAGAGRILRLDTSASGVGDVLDLARPNLPQAYGVADLTPYVAFPPRRAVELLTAIDPAARYRSGASRLSRAELLGHPVLDLLGVSAVLAREELPHPRLETVLARPGFAVHRREPRVPLVRVVPRAVATASDATALGLLASGTVDPARATVLAPGVEAGPPPAHQDSPFAAGEVEVERPAPQRLDVRVRGTSGGWLVMSAGWAPGWRATVDGERVPLVRADHALRALRLPPGDHEVRTWYAPWSLRVGAALTVLAVLCALALAHRATIPPRAAGRA